VLKKPLTLVNSLGEDEVQIINTKKCILFYTTKDVLFIEQVADAVKERLITFKVTGSDQWPNSLSQYLFKESLDDTVVITDMSIPKGYKFYKQLSLASADEVLKWISFVETSSPILNDIDKFEIDFGALSIMLEKKDELSLLQQKHVQAKADIVQLKLDVIEDVGSATLKFESLKGLHKELLGTLDPLEKLFGSPLDFECVNKDGEKKSAKALLEGKSHLLI